MNKITVELSDLDWAERETVLRLLFSKMNTGEQASNWREKGSSRDPSRQTGTGLNQGFRQDEEDLGSGGDEYTYGGEDAYYDAD